MNRIPKQILLSYIAPHELDNQLVRNLNNQDAVFLRSLNEVLLKAAPSYLIVSQIEKVQKLLDHNV